MHLIQISEPARASGNMHLEHVVSSYFVISDDKLSITYTGKGLSHAEHACAKANFPAIPLAKSTIFYYEATIIDSGLRASITVGLVDKSFSFSKYPGSTAKSYGLKADGRVYHRDLGESYSIKKATGDVIGCGINFETREIFFTHNGVFSGVAFSDIPIREYYPAVSLQSQRECVKCNFKGPFKFDIEGFIQEYEIRQNAGIQAEKISEMRVREFVISYLIANGYVKTLKTLGSYESYDSMGMITYSRIGDRVLDYELEESELATIKEVSSDESWTDYSLSDSSRINLSLETEETLKTVYLSTLNIRSEIRECIMKGNIEYAINYISEHYPRVLQTSKEADLALKIQQFIEIIKTQEVYSAFEYARNNLSCYRNSLIMVRKEVDTAVNISEVLGLLCYTDPFTSPLAYLLGKQQLEMTADIVNEEIISNTYLECEGVRYENSIEILLKQLLLVHKEYRKQHLLCPTDDISLLI